MGISAGMFTLHDVISINRKVHLDALTDFFMIMEVYGHDTELSFNEESLKDVGDELSLLRMKAFKRLTHITSSIKETTLSFEGLKEHFNSE